MIRIRRRLVLLLVWMAAAPVGRAAAQPATATLSANIGNQARLSLSTTSISFPDEDPDVVPQVPAVGGALLVTAKARATAGAQVLLTVLATDDLRSGVTVLPASNITWSATGAGFAAGTLSATTPATLGSWIGSGVHSGTQQLYFRNLWTHPTGTYTTSIVYTLSAP
jgi:hypothetical protein